MNKKIIKKILLALLLIALSYGLYRGGEKSIREYKQYKEREALLAEYQTFINKCLDNIDQNNHGLVLNQLRHCVHNNSTHMIDEEFYTTAKKGKLAFDKLVLSHARGELPKKPHLECSKRSSMLVRLYRALGYKAYNVVIVRVAPEFPDHVVTEVFNPDSQRYEMQDPTFDVYIKHVKTEKKADVFDLIKQDADDFLPCNINNECSWKITSPDGRSRLKLLKKYWNFSYLKSYSTIRGPFWYNSEKANPYDKFDETKYPFSYCDRRPSQCRKSVDIKKQESR